MVKKKSAKKSPVKIKKAKARSAGNAGSSAFLGFAAGWVLTVLALFTLPNYRMLLPAWYPLGHLPFWVVLAAGFALMVHFLRKIPETPAQKDWPVWVSRGLFWLLLVAAFAIRMVEPNRPPGFFNDDHYIIATDMRRILDYG